jgi:hypothetical protein
LIDMEMTCIDAELDLRRGVVELEQAVGGDLQ